VNPQTNHMGLLVPTWANVVLRYMSVFVCIAKASTTLLYKFERHRYGRYVIANPSIPYRLGVAAMNILLGWMPAERLPFKKEDLTLPRSVCLYDGSRIAIKGREFDAIGAVFTKPYKKFNYMASLNDKVDATILINTFAASLTLENGITLVDLLTLGKDLIDRDALLDLMIADSHLVLNIVSIADFVENVYTRNSEVIL
jgi:hypothetical protein